MQLRALLVTLLLGSSTVAMAAPNAPGFAPEIRDHRTAPPAPARGMSRWSLVATGHLVRGRELLVLDSATKIDQLRLELVGPGELFVDKLVVTFANGRSQTIDVDRWMTARRASAVIDLRGRGRRITSVAVHGRGNGTGFRPGVSFELLAR